MNKSIIFPTLVLILSVIACNAPSSATPIPTGGIVQGVVYGDLNSDGVIDDSEQISRVGGVEVSLTDCGPTQTTLTDVDGKFLFQDLQEGTCHVAVSKAGWIYNGSFPVLNQYPIPVASDPELPTAFSIYMAPVIDSPPTNTFTPEVSNATPTISPTPTVSSPMVTPTDVDVNTGFGPGTNYLSTGSLRMGEVESIHGTINNRSWWQIEDPRDPGKFCWVKAELTTTFGDILLVPLLAVPTGLVTDVIVTTPPVVHGFCGGPNSTTFSVSLTTNGPATVTYHLEIFNQDGTLRNATDNTNLLFTEFATKTFDPGGAYRTDCGVYLVKVIVTAPNNKTGQASWSVVSP